ncbi:MAG: hypothetical protein ACRC62_35550, partial [Microcoleus sp.]
YSDLNGTQKFECYCDPVTSAWGWKPIMVPQAPQSQPRPQRRTANPPNGVPPNGVPATPETGNTQNNATARPPRRERPDRRVPR